jgi:hypothetical protein
LAAKKHGMHYLSNHGNETLIADDVDRETAVRKRVQDEKRAIIDV